MANIQNTVENITTRRRRHWINTASSLNINQGDTMLMAETIQQAIKTILTFKTSYASSGTKKTVKTRGGFVSEHIVRGTPCWEDYQWMFEDDYNAGTFGDNGLGFTTCCLFLAIDVDKLRTVVQTLIDNSKDNSEIIKDCKSYILDNFSSYDYIYNILYNNKYI